jgi:hypothetical protein
VYPVALRDEIRTWVLIQGKSQRAAARHFGLSRNTVAKLLEEEPAANERQYQRQAPPKAPVRDAALTKYCCAGTRRGIPHPLTSFKALHCIVAASVAPSHMAYAHPDFP